MPKMAYMKDKTGLPIKATEVGIADINKEFICCTEDCKARMSLVSGGTERAYFRSKDIKEHISSMCIKSSIVFEESKYDETRFDLNFAFESMLGIEHTNERINRGHNGNRQGCVGGNRKLRIHTIGVLYAMCLDKGKDGAYNKISINDILADDENFDNYKEGITGYRLVEVSKYHKVKDELAFIMNYPSLNREKISHVKIVFEDKELFWKQYYKIKDSHYVEPIIIAGDWQVAPEGYDYHSQCRIRTDSQIYYVKEH